MKTGRFFAAVVLVWALLSSISLGYSGWIAGKTGNALAFDGVNDYVEVAGYQGIVGTQSRTCSAWIKTTAVQQGNIVSWGAEQNGQRWSFRTESNGTLAVGVYGGQIYTTATVNDGEWHHVAAVLNNDGSPSVDKILFYIDGALQGTTANSTQSIGTIALQDVMIGAYKNAGVPAVYFNGLLDEVCIYGRALDANEIDPEAPIPTDGLVAHWAMDETEGAIAHDSVSSYDGVFKSINYSGGSGTEVDPYQIANKADLSILAATTTHYNKCFILTADIDLDGQVFTKAIIAPDTSSSDNFQGTSFTGVFDGNGHKIINMIINEESNDYIGLFGYIDAGSEIKNLGLENCIISGISGSYNVGGLVGYVYSGSISNCYTNGSVSGYSHVGGLVGYHHSSISHCYSTASVSGYVDVGGLVGNNDGSISHCYSTGIISGVSGSQHVGGLIGINNEFVSNCYSVGAVGGYSYVGGLVGLNVITISNCYSTGTVSGSSYVGGLVGSNSSGSVKNSFWDMETSGRANSAGGTGKTMAEMKTLATFAGFGWISGRKDNALMFDGTGSYVDVPGYKGIVGTQSRTCSAWIKTTSTVRGNIVSWGTDQAGQKWLFRTESRAI